MKRCLLSKVKGSFKVGIDMQSQIIIYYNSFVDVRLFLPLIRFFINMIRST